MHIRISFYKQKSPKNKALIKNECCRDSTAIHLSTFKNTVSRMCNKADYINMRVNKVIEILDGQSKGYLRS